MFGYKLLLCVIVVLQISFVKALKIPKDYKFVKCKLAPVKRHYNKKLHIKHSTNFSTNWSGYAAFTNLTNPKVNSVSYIEGWWRVPKLSGTPTDAFNSTWVGIDGFTSSTVEQLGTERDWFNGQQFNFAWFEMFPASENRTGLFGFPVDVNDLISASVKYLGNRVFEMTIINHTKKVFHIVPTKFTTASFVPQRSSAEWIAEAPCCTTSGAILPLANFGTTFFYSCQCTINGTLGPINNSKWQNIKIDMLNDAGTAIRDVTSNLTCSGKNFNVVWKHE